MKSMDNREFSSAVLSAAGIAMVLLCLFVVALMLWARNAGIWDVL